MKYRLVTTKKGQFPIFEIEKGTEVLCHGKWVKAPGPVKGEVITCSFDTLPDTSFEKKFVEKNIEVTCNHQPVLNEFIKPSTGLTVRGYLHEKKKKDSGVVSFDFNDFSFWYPRLIAFFDKVVFPNIGEFKDNRSGKRVQIYYPFPKLKELYGNELSERNLEFYLEGILRKRMYWEENTFMLPEILDESDKMVLRLLDIDIRKLRLRSAVTNPVSLLKHIKDDFNKARLDDDKIRIMLIRSYELPQYTPGYKITDKKEEIDWILPGINPDINCLHPEILETIDDSINPQVQKNIHTVKADSWNRNLSHLYNENNLWEKLQKSI